MTPGENKPNYKDTLNLPKTSFSMKADLAQREPEILKVWEKESVYKNILAKKAPGGKPAKTYFLHDGPPYANGHIHMGHVLNKILKDMVVKYASMKGFYARYIPGWDCHGLPVEHQLFKELNMTKDDIDQVTFRKKAYHYAMKFVKIQSDEFKRLGVFAEWDNPYLTLTKEYESSILSALADLFKGGYIYKGLKPVNWCKTCETALAEAEVEYEDKLSPSIYVKFSSTERYEGKPLFFLVWTTTPWTLIANVAVALHPDLEYSYVSANGEVWVALSERVEYLMKRFGIADYTVLKKTKGSEIISAVKNAKHPFIDRSARLVLAEYVTKDDGTGCVHTAPGHGQDDYNTGKKYNLPVLMPVDNRGRFTREAGSFEGQDVYAANDGIIQKMKENGTLLLSEKVEHSYPHCWRCKSPIIFRATEQWFLSIDHEGLRGRMMDIVRNDVIWVPPVGLDRIGSMIETRPDWCLSRQRYWGVPIPAFECVKCGTSFTDEKIIRRVAELSKEQGADVWFEKSVTELIPHGKTCDKCGNTEFKKEENILDVWFDSGVSHRAIGDAHPDLRFPADLYLEGSDQHRGWFQAALITSTAINKKAPYKTVLTHGFVVDGEGKKMSKSLGNVISPFDIMKKYGADILRLWVASSDYEGDIKISDEILARLADGYRKIRNTFRFLLSNLYDFDHSENAIQHDKLCEIDRWILARLSTLVMDVTSYYDKHEYYKVYRRVYDFCVVDVSNFYLDVLKDILYVEGKDSMKRRSAQTAIFHILDVLVRLLAPILSFTMEEVWQNFAVKGKEASVHMADWPDMSKCVEEWKDNGISVKFDRMLSVRDFAMKLLEEKRAKGEIGSPLDARLEFTSASVETLAFLAANAGVLPLIFRVSQVDVVAHGASDTMTNVPNSDIKVAVYSARGSKCARCWNYQEEVGKLPEYPDLCPRCSGTVESIKKN
ncbi:MAG: isoleucine--tRNA ligase [Candidatus Omnitrophica bacterium]|nr:isoleucine--tRNA ligase [Candidatus Omnitrophota bacterium]